MNLEKKVAIITGAAQGLGRAMALRLAEAGANLGLLDVDEDKLKLTAAEAHKYGRQTVIWGGDVSNRETVFKFHHAVAEQLGRIDVLVNNAGNFNRSPFLEMTEEDWDSIQAVHLKGAVFSCQASIGHMVEKGIKGSVINLSSISAFVGFPWSAAYCTAKGGIPSLTRVLAREFGEHGVRVNAIAPGQFDTPMNQWFLTDPEMLPGVLEHIPLGYVGDPKEVANVVLFLASEDSSYITGATIPVDGGYLTF